MDAIDIASIPESPPVVESAATAPAAETLTAETAPTRIREVRAELLTVTDGRRHDELMAQLEGAYKILPPEAEASSTPGEPLAVPPVPWELQGQYKYDDAALAELGPAVASAGIPLDDIRLWIEAGHGHMVMRTRMNPETVDRVMAERFGDRVDAVIDDAKSVLARLTPKSRESVERFLDDTGLSDSPAFIEWLAGHGARLRQGAAA